ncbi:MAG TPA: ferritin-like domain-containing protein [Burkholderiales bacterium]|jgi:ferritin-like protein|nr:ferritin-like domain-containing protein [Burkholderiales bacterium]
MSFLLFARNNNLNPSRRAFLGESGLLLSASAVALLAGCESLAAGQKSAGGNGANDVAILVTALGAEREAVAAYQLGADSGLLDAGVKTVALKFQGHHKAHADLIAATVSKLGGRPPEAKSKYDFPVEKLKSQADVLRFAAQLEQGAVSAYLGAVPLFDNRDLSRAAASILGDEAMHLAVLRSVLGEDPVPAAFVG